MIAPACRHERTKRHGKDRNGNQRFRCLDCGKTWSESHPKPLGNMRVPVATAKLALRLLVEEIGEIGDSHLFIFAHIII